MKNEFENQLNNIRIELYEKTREMTNSEIARLTNENAGRIAAQFGITMTKRAFPKPLKSAEA
jgi:hypothetical protein